MAGKTMLAQVLVAGAILRRLYFTTVSADKREFCSRIHNVLLPQVVISILYPLCLQLFSCVKTMNLVNKPCIFDLNFGARGYELHLTL